jgi:putative Mg2+ transporter-C (MgtC) family protein
MAVLDAVDPSSWQIIGRLAVGLGLGAVIGLERELDGHEAGVRTHALLALGSALFGAISVGAFGDFVAVRATTNVQVDVTRVASYVVAGIGFLVGGTIIKHSDRVRGLTTASSLYVTAGIGLAAGLGFYVAAVAATIATFAMLALEHVIARVYTRGKTMSVQVVVQSMDAALAIARSVDSGEVRPRRISRKLRDDGSVELVLTGVQVHAGKRMIADLDQRDDVVEMSYAKD